MNLKEQLHTYTWRELIEMHKFYMFGAETNKQCKQLLNAIEKELVDRSCASADLWIEGGIAQNLPRLD